MSGDRRLSACKRRMKDRLWYGDDGRRRGVCKVLVRKDVLMICWRGKRWTTAKGDVGGCPVNQTFRSTSSISKVANWNMMKLKPMLSDLLECKQRRPAVGEVIIVEELVEPTCEKRSTRGKERSICCTLKLTLSALVFAGALKLLASKRVGSEKTAHSIMHI